LDVSGRRVSCFAAEKGSSGGGFVAAATCGGQRSGWIWVLDASKCLEWSRSSWAAARVSNGE
jgi:hypothetical protein